MICLDTISTVENVILTNKNPKEKYEKNYQYTNK